MVKVVKILQRSGQPPRLLHDWLPTGRITPTRRSRPQGCSGSDQILWQCGSLGALAQQRRPRVGGRRGTCGVRVGSAPRLYNIGLALGEGGLSECGLPACFGSTVGSRGIGAVRPSRLHATMSTLGWWGGAVRSAPARNNVDPGLVGRRGSFRACTQQRWTPGRWGGVVRSARAVTTLDPGRLAAGPCCGRVTPALPLHTIGLAPTDLGAWQPGGLGRRARRGPCCALLATRTTRVGETVRVLAELAPSDPL